MCEKANLADFTEHLATIFQVSAKTMSDVGSALKKRLVNQNKDPSLLPKDGHGRNCFIGKTNTRQNALHNTSRSPQFQTKWLSAEMECSTKSPMSSATKGRVGRERTHVVIAGPAG
jgi:hypothetical protein